MRDPGDEVPTTIGQTLRVMADQRPCDAGPLPAGAVYAVFDAEPEEPAGSGFLGLVGLSEIATNPQRIFADLIPSRAPSPVSSQASPEEILRRMRANGSEWLPMLDSEGTFVGVATRPIVMQEVLRQERELFEESRRLNASLQDDLRAATTRLVRQEELAAASRRLVALVAAGSASDIVLQEGIDALRALLEARYGAISILDEAGRIIQFIQSGLGPEEARAIGRLPEGRGLLGAVVRDGKVLRLERISDDPRAAGFPEHHPPMRTLLATPISHEARIYGRVYLCDRTNGEPFTADDEALVMSYSKWLGLVQAYTLERERRRETEITLRRREEQLNQVHKMEAIGRLAGGVAHDFNNLLMVITGYCETLAEDLPSGAPARHDVGEIHKAARLAASLTRQLLAFSRKQVFELKILDLNAVVEETRNMLRRLIGGDVELVFIAGPALRKVRADPGQIEQVLLNLAANARDAMPDGGKLMIETAAVLLDAGDPERRSVMPPGPYVRLAVSDTGCGMDGPTQARIFEPFFTTKEIGRGTGLGLATVYGSVKQSGGYIWVYSEPGRGTTFRIYLPGVEAEAEEIGPDRDEVAPLRGGETILLVDDDEAVRAVARRILESYGYTVLDALDASEAGRIARERGASIRLLVTDVVMPGVAGPALAARLKESAPHLKVLFVSGYTDAAIAHRGVLEPGTAFLEKPFSMTAFARKVREVLDSSG